MSSCKLTRTDQLFPPARPASHLQELATSELRSALADRKDELTRSQPGIPRMMVSWAIEKLEAELRRRDG